MESNTEEFDYIVVGAGSAGASSRAVLAKLGSISDCSSKQVAGHVPLDPHTDGAAKLYANPAVNWCYLSELELN
jgi:tRNA U34 5-carboxymethylaminomethyl modifying enzyme MnmG/GidA